MIYLNQNKENYNKQLTSLILKNRTKNRQLEDNDIYKRLHELEVKMQSMKIPFIVCKVILIQKRMKISMEIYLKNAWNCNRKLMRNYSKDINE